LRAQPPLAIKSRAAQHCINHAAPRFTQNKRYGDEARLGARQFRLTAGMVYQSVLVCLCTAPDELGFARMIPKSGYRFSDKIMRREKVA
jgi:hypothetical protein